MTPDSSTADTLLAQASLDDGSLATLRRDEDERLSETIERARDGSREALDRLLEELMPKLHTMIRVRMDDRIRERLDSIDVLQETMIKAFRGIGRFRGSGQRSLMAWLRTIAVHEIRRAAEHHHRERRALDREVKVDPANPLAESRAALEARLSRRLDLQRLERALVRLGGEQREVVLLRAFEGRSFGEIGAVLGKSADASRMQFARALAALTVELRDLGEGAPTRAD